MSTPTTKDAPDAPTGGSALRIETHGIDVIAESERKGEPRSLFWPWCAANIAVLAVSWGGYVLGFGLSMVQAIVLTVLGVTASFLLVGLASLAGQKGSAPTLVLARASFGVVGNGLPGLVSYLLLIGWEIFLCSMAVLASGTVAERLAPGSGSAAKIITLVVVAAIVVTLGILGFEAIMKFQKWLTIATMIMTVAYMALTLDRVDLGAAMAAPSAPATAVIGAGVMLLAGFGVGWTNCAADYSRYLPRTASKAGIIGWTTFGGALPVVVLTVYGVLLCASDPTLLGAVSDDPIGALTEMLPTWFLVPFALVAVAGLVAGAIIDIYSSGLTLLTMGLPVKRWVAAAVDGVLMIIGTVAVAWFATDFITPFTGFLITLGVPLAAWSGIFVADLLLRRDRYDEAKLFDASLPGGYGRVRWDSILIMVISSVIGFGLVTNSGASWLAWQGYLLDLGLGGREGPWAYANIGVLVALALSFIAYLLIGRSRVRAQEGRPIH
ncbi:purine-cytosine permease family protein [Propionibacteriaceae bacterium Y1685]|uniref:purine-cytosine permease family protein n=1 Tax=Microlunatus sp. Y1700 TaxID=3418487 RepID=UPI003B8081A9